MELFLFLFAIEKFCKFAQEVYIFKNIFQTEKKQSSPEHSLCNLNARLNFWNSFLQTFRLF